ncbi:hypothetical protein [Sagittula salina]|uniref:Uncharacterized protein n=1 Tax=Sagittula salina TaxID=2820268 RepID=A0A940MR40_9RHOB|nr:hypothetical protein [Sagittula salina]MBP0484363.1 hypothetical protein [Sagittula salina]
MPEDPDLSVVLCVLAGALAIAAGALGALNLDPAFTGLLGVLVVLRICWLDDNIANDLLDRDHLPQSYLNAQARQRMVEIMLLGKPWGEVDLSPGLVATRMRAEAQVWSAVIVSGCAALLADTAPFGVGVSLVLALGGFLLAFRMADRISATLWLVECGRALPRRDLLQRPGWALLRRRYR